MKKARIWRNATPKELEYLKSCTSMDFDIIKGPNTKAWWIVTFEYQLLTGWFDLKETAQKWIDEKKYLEPTTQWAIDYNMDI